MNIDYKKIFIYFIFWTSLQSIFILLEGKYYLDMISDIQGYKYNFYKNYKNEFTLKSIILYFFGNFLLTLALYYYIVLQKKTAIDSAILMIFITLIWDGAIFICFDKSSKHLPVFLFDILIVGGLCAFITTYLLYNYYDYIKNYTFLLFLLFLFNSYLALYYAYKYNPDLSNIKRIVLF
jgi:hypothetical protein